jgi:hypothetical protein
VRTTEKDDILLAAVALVGHTGASHLTIGFSEEHDPPVWFAVVRYGSRHEAAGAMTPRGAVLRLLDQLVDGGMCAHCQRPTGVTIGEWLANLEDLAERIDRALFELPEDQERALEQWAADEVAARQRTRTTLAELEAEVRPWPKKLDIIADWLDTADRAFEVLAELTSGQLREQWREALGDDDHDGVQRDVRAFAGRLRVLLREPAPPEGTHREE